MRTLVLGGTRFIGLHLVEELLRLGHEVTVLNRGQTEAKLPPEVPRLQADRNDPAAMKDALAGRDFDAVYDISAYTRQQIEPAVNALEGRVGRYVYISSIAVYEPSDTLPIPETHPLAFDSSLEWDYPMHQSTASVAGRDADRRPVRQFADYGRGKIECEECLRERWRAISFPYTAFRPVMVYGPGNERSQTYWEMAHFARLRRGRPILIPGDGTRIMQFIHVDDLASAFASVVETRASMAQEYNMAGPDAGSLTGYIRMLGEVVGVEPEMIYVERANEFGNPSSFPFVWYRSAIYSIAKARSHFGFDPRPLRSGLEQTYDWYCSQSLDAHPWDFSAEDELIKQMGI